MLAKLLRELLLTGLTLLFLAGAVVVYHRSTGGTVADLDPRPALEGIDRRWLLAGIGALLVAALFALYRRPPTTARPGAGCTPWILALAAIALCACAIAGLYHAPDTIRISDSIVLERMPRDEFVRALAWGATVIGGLHLVLFLAAAALARRPARGARPARPAR